MREYLRTCATLAALSIPAVVTIVPSSALNCDPEQVFVKPTLKVTFLFPSSVSGLDVPVVDEKPTVELNIGNSHCCLMRL